MTNGMRLKIGLLILATSFASAFAGVYFAKKPKLYSDGRGNLYVNNSNRTTVSYYHQSKFMDGYLIFFGNDHINLSDLKGNIIHEWPTLSIPRQARILENGNLGVLTLSKSKYVYNELAINGNVVREAQFEDGIGHMTMTDRSEFLYIKNKKVSAGYACPDIMAAQMDGTSSILINHGVYEEWLPQAKVKSNCYISDVQYYPTHPIFKLPTVLVVVQGAGVGLLIDYKSHKLLAKYMVTDPTLRLLNMALIDKAFLIGMSNMRDDTEDGFPTLISKILMVDIENQRERVIHSTEQDPLLINFSSFYAQQIPNDNFLFTIGGQSVFQYDLKSGLVVWKIAETPEKSFTSRNKHQQFMYYPQLNIELRKKLESL